MKTSQKIPYPEMHGDTSWFREARFGLFVHWGLYAMGARWEWLMHLEEQKLADYEQKYFRNFNPDLYRPENWADLAVRAGMKYAVMTAKHHEGFCLWNSAHTDFKATRTRAGRDLLRPFVEAVRERDMRVGLYHSLIDWHHPDFVVDPHIGPLRNAPNREELNASRDMKRYAKYLHAQVRELLTQFGPIDLLWLDFSYPKPDGSGKCAKDWNSEELLRLVRKLMPKVILNDRLDLPYGWDVKTPEQMLPRRPITVGGKPVVWEACQTLANSWGYNRDEGDWRDADEIIRTLIECVSRDGNLLLNIGPNARGEIDARATTRLEAIGDWMRLHGSAIHGCTAAPPEFQAPAHTVLTYHPGRHRLYVHVFAWPYNHLFFEGDAWKDRVEYAQLLHDHSEVLIKGIGWQAETPHLGDMENLQTSFALTLPHPRPNVAVPVIELFLKQ